MIGSLFSVFWEDHWRPWLTAKLKWFGWTVLVFLSVGFIFFGLIYLEMAVDHVVRRIYGG
jgi:hypothetical protein